MSTLFRVFPVPVLGVILFVGGMELASSIHVGGDRADRVAQVPTAGIALWNPGVAYVAGLLLHQAGGESSFGLMIQAEKSSQYRPGHRARVHRLDPASPSHARLAHEDGCWQNPRGCPRKNKLTVRSSPPVRLPRVARWDESESGS